jgi:hypothetical protein
MTIEILNLITQLMMCDDPTMLKESDRDKLDAWADEQSRLLGFRNWIDSYHWNKNDSD